MLGLTEIGRAMDRRQRQGEMGAPVEEGDHANAGPQRKRSRHMLHVLGQRQKLVAAEVRHVKVTAKAVVQGRVRAKGEVPVLVVAVRDACRQCSTAGTRTDGPCAIDRVAMIRVVPAKMLGSGVLRACRQRDEMRTSRNDPDQQLPDEQDDRDEARRDRSHVGRFRSIRG